MSLNGNIHVTDRRPSPANFPKYSHDAGSNDFAIEDDIPLGSPAPGPLPDFSQLHSGDRWQHRRSTDTGQWKGTTRPARQKSLSEALRTVRTRRASVSQNAVEIAEALAPPVSVKLVVLCLFWYITSIVSNASSKAILTALPKPVTLTVVQFLFVCFWCIFSSAVARMYAPIRTAMPVLKFGIRRPDKEIVMATLPLVAFQVGGHILNSDAMSRIPVSLVHTIKGLSPLFTVLAYRTFYGVRYSFATYASLAPLTLGVIMACSASFRVEFVGLLYAFGSAMLFVTQNIVSKSIFVDAAKEEADGVPTKLRKPDKLNLLCYSSGIAFLITVPIWLWSEGFTLFADLFTDASVQLSGRPGSLDHGALMIEFFFNGTFHFIQSLVAFVLLGMTSPVTYSVASLIKRVFVIVFAIFWFGNPMTSVQASGIGLTIVGLYLYDRTSDADKADRKLRAKAAAQGSSLLPSVNADAKRTDSTPVNGARKEIGLGVTVSREPTPQGWLPPGTRQEDTWTRQDRRSMDVK